jgi:hypothetical protein
LGRQLAVLRAQPLAAGEAAGRQSQRHLLCCSVASALF